VKLKRLLSAVQRPKFGSALTKRGLAGIVSLPDRGEPTVVRYRFL